MLLKYNFDSKFEILFNKSFKSITVIKIICKNYYFLLILELSRLSKLMCTYFYYLNTYILEKRNKEGKLINLIIYTL